MVETAAANIFPALSRMAFRADIAETAAMWVLVARGTICKRHSGILYKSGDWLVAHFY